MLLALTLKAMRPIKRRQRWQTLMRHPGNDVDDGVRAGCAKCHWRAASGCGARCEHRGHGMHSGRLSCEISRPPSLSLLPPPLQFDR